MEILKTAAAGTLESSDAMITVESGQDKIELDITSIVFNQLVVRSKPQFWKPWTVWKLLPQK